MQYNKINKRELNFHDLDHVDKGRVETAVKGGFNRRDVLKLMMATGITMIAAENILISGSKAIAGTPKKGGTVRMANALHGPNDQTDPIRFTSSIDYSRGRAVYNGLVQHANDLSLKPELATSFEANSNATEWTFKLRKGVEWHDGTKFTADDVVWSMNRHLGDDSTSVIKSVMSTVKEWKKVGTYEVKAILHSPNADLPTLLGMFQNKVVKNGTTGGWIGTGPFTMESFQPGITSIQKRNENYWREGANLDSCEITAITDPLARVNALLAGDIQIISRVNPNSFRQIKEANGVTLLSTPASSQASICILKNTKPGESDDFVKGMQYIQDREHIVTRILKGKGQLGNDTPISAAHGADWCSELAQREYDPDKAKFYFKKSGYSGADLFVAPVTSGIEEISLLTQANCSKIGFKLNLKRVPNDGYWGSVWMKEPLNVVQWNMRPTANSQMALQFAPGGPWNDTYWNNKRMGELLSLSLAEIDPTRRHDMYCEMQTLIHNGSGMVIPAFSNINDAIANNVMNMPTVPLGPCGAMEWPEFIWLA